VSYVINGTKHVTPEKRQQVLDIIAKTGYQPNIVAKSLRTKKTNSIGVLVEDILAFATPRIINGISEYMENTDYHILLNDLRMMESLFNRYDQIIYQKDKINNGLTYLVYGAKVDAVIYVGMFDRDVSGIIPDIGKPVIIAYSTSNDSHTCYVTYENVDIAARMMRNLIDMGHRRIAVITGLAHTNPAQLRLRGIHKTFNEAGLTLDSQLVKNGDWERDSGYSCMKELLRDSPPTAVFAMNDLMAVGAMDAIKEAGLRVPQDISVVGFDNREVSEYVSPKLTTAEIDLKAIGYTAAQVAAEKLAGTDSKCTRKKSGATKVSGFAEGKTTDGHKIIIPSNIILRDSVRNLTI